MEKGSDQGPDDLKINSRNFRHYTLPFFRIRKVTVHDRLTGTRTLTSPDSTVGVNTFTLSFQKEYPETTLDLHCFIPFYVLRSLYHSSVIITTL